jgi:hypothetical protein
MIRNPLGLLHQFLWRSSLYFICFSCFCESNRPGQLFKSVDLVGFVLAFGCLHATFPLVISSLVPFEFDRTILGFLRYISGAEL